MGRTPKGYQQLTVPSTVVGLTLPTGTYESGPLAGGGAVTKRVSYALIVCSGANVRWRDDGTNPTSTVGVPLNATGELRYDGSMTAIKFIRSGATDATLDISYYD